MLNGKHITCTNFWTIFTNPLGRNFFLLCGSHQASNESFLGHDIPNGRFWAQWTVSTVLHCYPKHPGRKPPLTTGHSSTSYSQVPREANRDYTYVKPAMEGLTMSLSSDLGRNGKLKTGSRWWLPIGSLHPQACHVNPSSRKLSSQKPKRQESPYSLSMLLLHTRGTQWANMPCLLTMGIIACWCFSEALPSWLVSISVNDRVLVVKVGGQECSAGVEAYSRPRRAKGMGLSPPGGSWRGEHWPAASGGSLPGGHRAGRRCGGCSSCISGCPLQTGRSAGPRSSCPGRCGPDPGSLGRWFPGKITRLILTIDSWTISAKGLWGGV